MEKKKEWRRVSENAWILGRNGGGDFYVVYQYYPVSREHETTLVRKNSYEKGDDEHFPLDGDHRESYKELSRKGFKACLEFYWSFPAEDPEAKRKKK